MKTVYARACDVIRKHQPSGCAEPECIANLLKDAGLLAPELPAPNDPDIIVPDGKGWLPGGPDGPSVWTAPGGRVMVQRIEPGDLTPDEARDAAHALLAAADYSEGEQ